MEFRRSAGIFVTGICFVVGGPVLAFIGSTFGAWATFAGIDGGPDAPSSDMAGFFIVLVIVGALLSIVGFCLLIAAVHRALVKIDALPVGVQPGNRDNRVSNRR